MGHHQAGEMQLHRAKLQYLYSHDAPTQPLLASISLQGTASSNLRGQGLVFSSSQWAQCDSIEQVSTSGQSFRMLPQRRHARMWNIRTATAPTLDICTGYVNPQHQLAAAASVAHRAVAAQVFVFLNQHVLPLVTHMTTAQHNMAQRVRAFRPGLFLRRLRGMSEAHHHSQRSKQLNQQGRVSKASQVLAQQAKVFEGQLNPVAAAAAFHAAVEQDSTSNKALQHAEWLALAAKNWSDASYQDGCPLNQQREYNIKAIDLSSQAAEMAPDAVFPYVARCVAKGRLALISDNKTKVQLAREACDDAQRALDLGPDNDLAQHVMGRWQYEMASLNPIARTIVRMLFGTQLMQGSYYEALRHYQTAAALAPTALIHKVELGRTLDKIGQPHDAVQHLQEALNYEVTDLNDHLQKLDAERMLRKLKWR